MDITVKKLEALGFTAVKSAWSSLILLEHPKTEYYFGGESILYRYNSGCKGVTYSFRNNKKFKTIKGLLKYYKKTFNVEIN